MAKIKGEQRDLVHGGGLSLMRASLVGYVLLLY